MAVIGTRSFRGEIPRTEPHLLGDSNAQRAVDCHFANGSLKSLLGNPSPIGWMANNPVKGIYTEDGINFYTWNVEAQAYKSPVIDDTHNRLYFLLPSQGEFRVASKIGMAFNGPSPSSGNQWKAGVPRPIAAPKLRLIERTTIPGYNGTTDDNSISVTAEVWWSDSNGKTYPKVTLSPAMPSAFREFTFARPAEPVIADEEDANDAKPFTLWVKLIFTESRGGTVVMSCQASDKSEGRSSAFPGGLEMTVGNSGASSSVSIQLKWGTAETRAYVYTSVNTWDEEGSPSPASTVSVTYMQDVQIEFQHADFTGYRPFQTTYLYRTFGTSPTYLQAEYEWSGGNFLYDRSWKPKSGGKALESQTWTPPPTGLQGSELMPNGWFAAFKGNTLYMSEPYRPHAWPYNMTFPLNIRGIKVAQQSLVVTTVDGVYIVAGAFPGAAQQVKLSTPQAGIAQRAMANIDGAVAYISNDGFVLVEGTTASVSVSQQLFDRRTWKDRYSNQLITADMRLAYHDGALVCSHSNPVTGPGGFILRMDDDAGSFARLNARYDATFQLPTNDALYYSSGPGIYQFGSGSELPFDWWSKDHIYPSQVTFGAGFIRCTGSVTLTLYADGVEVASKVVSTGHFRLRHDMPKRLRWSYRLMGTGTVHEFMLGRSMQELQSV